ncbi:MAG: PAS domain S-box protein, partial [Bacteroidetes bacterium]|nr:PAS domain S-box protein [Bacteroidota bacterium]
EALQRDVCVRALESALAAYRSNLAETLERLTEAAPETPLFLMTIYNPFSGGSSVIDEIGVLARTFNEMTGRLRVLYKDLDQEINERKHIELALRDSEEHYRTFVAQSTEGIWRAEVDQPFSIDLPEDEQVDRLLRYGYLAGCNDAYAQMYGYEKADDIIGARTADFMSPPNPRYLDFLHAFIRGAYRIVDAESVERDKHGTPRYFSNSLIGIIEDGMYLRAWGTQRDITERKKAQEERERFVEELEAKNAELERFA